MKNRQDLKQITDTINRMCGDNGVTTIGEVANELSMSYSKVHYRIHKAYQEGCVGIIYPGLGMGRNSQRKFME